jgi:hypothetical protein
MKDLVEAYRRDSNSQRSVSQDLDAIKAMKVF